MAFEIKDVSYSGNYPFWLEINRKRWIQKIKERFYVKKRYRRLMNRYMKIEFKKSTLKQSYVDGKLLRPIETHTI